MPAVLDITNERYGRLVAVSPAKEAAADFAEQVELNEILRN